jgi:hypothetical protein
MASQQAKWLHHNAMQSPGDFNLEITINLVNQFKELLKVQYHLNLDLRSSFELT